MPENPIPAVLYAAKSTADVRGSIPDQLRDCERLAARKGYELTADHHDEAASAYHGDRGSGLAAAMADCERLAAERGECVLIVQHSDRLARGDAKEARHLIEVVLWALKAGVQLVSVQDPEILAGGDLQLLLGAIGGMRNHQDSKRKGLAVKGGMARRAKRGLANGGPRPYGFERTAQGLVILEPEAAIIRRIFAEFIAGRGQRQIARDLNADGITSQRGSDWYQGTIAHYLANPLYRGAVVLNGEVYDGAHDAIVDPETWQQAKQLRAALARTQGGGRGRYATGSHLLTKGHLRCGKCGDAMIPRTTPTRTPGQVAETYACYGRMRNGTDSCDQRPVKRELIDTAIWRFFDLVGHSADSTRQAIAATIDAKLAEADALLDQAERDVVKAEERLARVRGDYFDGNLSASDWQEFRDELTGELDAARAQADRHQAQRMELTEQLGAIDVEAAVLQELGAVRAMVAGQVKEGGREGIAAARAALRRLFASFELLEGFCFGRDDAGTPDSVAYGHGDLVVEQGDRTITLLPFVRTEAITAWWDGQTEFPALKRAALALRANNADGLTSASYPQTPIDALLAGAFPPIPVQIAGER